MKNYVGPQSYFRPLILLLGILGIPIVIHRDAISTCKYRLLRLWGWFLFAANVATATYEIYLLTYLTDDVEQHSVTSTVSWTNIMMQCNVTIFKLGSHFKLLHFASSSRQIELAKTIRGLWAPELKIRPLSIVTLVIIVLVTIH